MITDDDIREYLFPEIKKEEDAVREFDRTLMVCVLFWGTIILISLIIGSLHG